MSAISRSAGVAARGVPVFLPYTEASADENTFVCTFDGGANANEIGAGLGLTGADLVFTQVGGVAAASGGFRALDSTGKAFTCTVPFLQAFMNGPEWTLMPRMRNMSAVGVTKYWQAIAGTTSFNNGNLQAGYFASQFTRAGSPAITWALPASFSGAGDYWVPMWKKAGIIHLGFVQASGDIPPTGWDDFPASQRVCQYGVPDFTADAWGSMRYIVGFVGYTATFEIGRIIASKLGLQAAPI